jgi:hypothetical protein
MENLIAAEFAVIIVETNTEIAYLGTIREVESKNLTQNTNAAALVICGDMSVYSTSSALQFFYAAESDQRSGQHSSYTTAPRRAAPSRQTTCALYKRGDIYDVIRVYLSLHCQESSKPLAKHPSPFSYAGRL